MNGKRLDACNVILSVLCGHEIQSTIDFFACLGYLHSFSIYFLFLFLFQFYFSSLGRNWIPRNTNPQKTNTVLKKKNKKPHKWMSGTVVTICLFLWWLSAGRTDNGQKMTVCRIFENRLTPFYAFHLAFVLQAQSQVKLFLIPFLLP